jgi:DNA-binding transcriptional LysR family regulator
VPKATSRLGGYPERVPEPFVLAFVPGVTPSKWVGVWRERMPRAPIELRPLAQESALRLLRSGEATVALVRLPFDADGLSVIPLYSERPVVVVAREHPLAGIESATVADLSGETIIEGMDAAAVELVAAGVGVATMPQSIARSLSRKDVVARPITDGADTRIALAWAADSTTDLIEEFAGIVRGRTANSSRGR